MLKPYYSCNVISPSPPVVPAVSIATVPPQYCPEVDGLCEISGSVKCALFKNSEVLNNLESLLSHLSDADRADITNLINNKPLFSDLPTQTTAIFHDIDVKGHCPNKQHSG